MDYIIKTQQWESAKILNLLFSCLRFSTSESCALLQNKPYIYPDTFYKLTPRYWENRKQGRYLADFHQRIIDERREILMNNNNIKDDNTDSGYNIFIDHILNNPSIFTDQEIRDHVITVLSAGKYFNIKL